MRDGLYQDHSEETKFKIQILLFMIPNVFLTYNHIGSTENDIFPFTTNHKIGIISVFFT